MFQGRFKGVKECVKCVSRKCHKKFQGCFKNLSMKFVLQFCFSMNLIAATRAEGGFVLITLWLKDIGPGNDAIYITKKVDILLPCLCCWCGGVCVHYECKK